MMWRSDHFIVGVMLESRITDCTAFRCPPMTVSHATQVRRKL